MLDIRATYYVSPLSEVDFKSVPLTVHIVNVADETGLVTGKFRVYREDTGLLIHTSDIVPVTLTAGQDVDASALTELDPPAPLDDTYFVLFDGLATNPLVPDGIGIHLGAFHFDVKPVGMGPAPASHHATHEDGGSDPVDITDLPGTEHLLHDDGSVPLTAYLDIVESAPPANPAALTARIYAENQLGHTLLSFRDSSGMVRKLVRDSVFIAYNGTANPIPALSAVYAAGSFAGCPSIDLAQANAAATMPAIGITLEAIAAATTGRVMLAGLIENIDSAALPPGTRCWVSPAAPGGFVFAPPTWPNIRQEMATILVQDIAVGAAEVLCRSAFDDAVIDHAGLMNLAAGDPHPQYQQEAEKGAAGGYCGLPNPLDSTLPLRADGTAARPNGTYERFEAWQTSSAATAPWSSASIGAGGTLSNVIGTPNHPGVVGLKTGAAASTGVRIFTSPDAILIAGNESTTFYIRPQTLAGSVVRFGFHDSVTTADATDGAYLEMAQVGGVDGTLVGKTADGGARSTTATSTVLVTNTWYKASIVVNAAANLVTFSLYSEAGAVLWSDTLNANIPTAAGHETGHAINAHNTAGGAVTPVELDFMHFTIARVLVR